jgi:hypothetical protein
MKKYIQDLHSPLHMIEMKDILEIWSINFLNLVTRSPGHLATYSKGTYNAKIQICGNIPGTEDKIVPPPHRRR